MVFHFATLSGLRGCIAELDVMGVTYQPDFDELLLDVDDQFIGGGETWMAIQSYGGAVEFVDK